MISNKAIACVLSPSSGATALRALHLSACEYNRGFCSRRVCWRFYCVLGWGEEKKTPALRRGKLSIYLLIQNTYQTLRFPVLVVFAVYLLGSPSCWWHVTASQWDPSYRRKLWGCPNCQVLVLHWQFAHRLSLNEVSWGSRHSFWWLLGPPSCPECTQ